MKYHYCISLQIQTDKLTCLPIEKTSNGIVDCFGSTDEPYSCQQINRNGNTDICIGYLKQCNSEIDCLNGIDDEQFCMEIEQFYF